MLGPLKMGWPNRPFSMQYSCGEIEFWCSLRASFAVTLPMLYVLKRSRLSIDRLVCCSRGCKVNFASSSMAAVFKSDLSTKDNVTTKCRMRFSIILWGASTFNLNL